jgi:hypothetical protein
LEKIGRKNLTLEAIYSDVLEVYPNLNSLSIHTSKMIPSLALFENKLVWGSGDVDDF